MNITLLSKAVPVRAVPRRLRLAATAGLASIGSLALSGAAFAQSGLGGPATTTGGGLGAQVIAMSGEAITSGGTAAGMAMYAAALITFIGGAWAAWKSRQPQNRESGYVGMALAGLVLCGLFATGGTWINKAANTASGGNATVTDTAQVVKFQ